MNRSLFSKNYIVTVTAASLFYTAAYMVNSVCGKYTLAVGGTKAVAGLAVAAFTLSSFFTRPVWGWIVDRYSRRFVCIGGSVLCLVSAVMLIFAKNIPLLFVSRSIFGGGYSALTTAAGTVICDVAPQEKLQQAISFYGITNVLAQAVAPAAALWLYDKGFVWVAVVASFVTAVTLGLFFFVNYSEKAFTNLGARFAVYEKSALPAAYTIIFFALSTASVNSFIPLMTEEKGISGDRRFFVVSALFLLLARVSCTKITEKFGQSRIFYVGDIIYIIGFVLLVFTGNVRWLLLAALMYGLGAGLVHPIVNTAAVKDCRREKRGLATGTFMMSQDLGMTIGAALWGTVSENFGFGAVYGLVAILLLVMMYIFSKAVAPLLE